MNIERISHAHPDLDCRRIDIMIGEPRFWGRGIGTEAIRLLVRFGFERQPADLIFGFVSLDNLRSLAAFRKAGFEMQDVIESEEGGAVAPTCDLVILRPQMKPTR